MRYFIHVAVSVYVEIFYVYHNMEIIKGKIVRGGKILGKNILLFFMCCALLAGSTAVLAGCGKGSSDGDTSDLMEGVSPSDDHPDVDLSGPGAAAVTDFGVRLLQDTVGKGDTLVSPLSVISVLGMVENGARKETLEQMEQVLGIPCGELNTYLYQFIRSLPVSDRYKLHAAASIWLRDDEAFTVDPAFLQANADHYDAGVYKETFDDHTAERINGWAEENTDGMIDEIITEIPADAVMYLANALAFDAEWETIYSEDRVHGGLFTKRDGSQQSVDLMYSEEERYLEDDHATGFLKYYADQKYAFAALLPDEEPDTSEYGATLTGARLRAAQENAQEATVYAAIPRYTCEYSVALKPILQAMGLQDAFDPGRADFSGIGSYQGKDIYINEVLHKTYIAVEERGTRAGAVTLAEMMAKGVAPEGETVYLERPFVYMLIHCGTDVPVFIGVTEDVGE